MIEAAFPKLFEPAKIGRVRLKNRIVMLPMGLSHASVHGEVTQKTIDHYVTRAKDGVGMIIVGGTSPFAMPGLNRLVLYDDRFLAGHYELVEAVHAYGVPMAIQFNHAGRQWYPWALDGGQPVSASDVACNFCGGHQYPTPRPLEKEEMYQIMDKWAAGVGRAKKAGYDMVEIHAAHGYLIEQFMSPYTNKRTDEYGGSLENRMRFALELLERIRKVVGDKYPIGFRLGAEEFVAGGLTVKDTPAIAKILESAGAVYLNVACGIYETFDRAVDVMRQPEGWKEYIWQAIKEAVNIPVIAGGGLRTPAFCERILEQGKADFIGLARPLLADPEWPIKAREGRVEDIRPCLSCEECNHPSTMRRVGGGARRCSINPVTGREREFSELVPAEVKKRIMVIGGGPGGMEAARLAALRGHDVTLYEKGKDLGGALLLAAAPPGKEKIEKFRQYEKREVSKAGVKVKLGVEVTPELVKKEKPDAVVVATGSRPIKSPSFAAGKDIPTGWDVLTGELTLSGKRVVVVGGGMVGAETAEYLAARGNKVTIVEMLPEIASEMQMSNRAALLHALREAGVEMLTRKQVLDVSEKGVTALDKVSGEKTFIAGDAVILALGAVPNDSLSDALEGMAEEVYRVGDVNEPRIMMEAIFEGHQVGRMI
ncbi:MAG: FAD-dependent oxidoreductase [Chloroflexi bacterium]|nr:FAD-dependent oxidoreductase [Chloroflexota bacterium]